MEASRPICLVIAMLLLTSMSEVWNVHGTTMPGNSSTPVLYDEQLSLNFVQGFPSLGANVTAIEQCGNDTLGPAYLLNGLTNAGYWYQVGLSWNWPEVRVSSSGDVNVTASQGFNAVFQTWYPNGGEDTIPTLSPITVKQGDMVSLQLYFADRAIHMDLRDLNTNATARESWNAFNSTSFVGSPPNQPYNSNGFFSGFMTEQYHTSPYFGDEQTVTYWKSGSPLSSAWMVMDEWTPGSGVLTFKESQQVDYATTTHSQNFTSQGAFESSNSHVFQTGRLSSGPTCVPVTSLWDSYKYLIYGASGAAVFLGSLGTFAVFRRRWRANQVSPTPQTMPPTED